MAITIIKHGDKRRSVCPDCECLFSYEREDVRMKVTGYNENEYYILCPDCGVEINVPCSFV